jgi:hypothetical protein
MGAHFRPHALIHLDKRRKEAWFLEHVCERLTEQLGGDWDALTFSQQTLVHRASVLMLRLSMMDQRIIDNAPLTVADTNYTICWVNALRRVLVALGIKEGKAKANGKAVHLDSVMREIGHAEAAE